MAKQRMLRGSLAVAAMVVVSAVIVASFAPAAARSRAANRWNHVGGITTPAALPEPPIHGGRNRIELNEIYTEAFTFIDVGEPGDSPGDYGVFTDPVADVDTDEVVGSITVHCVAAYADQCHGSIKLDGLGQIVFDGITPLNTDPDVFAVTGGTREYLGVGGTLRVTFPTDDSARLIVKLSP